jgi:hypothetical protein
VKEYFYTQIIFWVTIIVNHIDAMMVLPSWYEGSCMDIGHVVLNLKLALCKASLAHPS